MNIGDRYVCDKICMTLEEEIEIVDYDGLWVWYTVVSAGIMDNIANNEIHSLKPREFRSYYTRKKNQKGKLYEIWVDELKPKDPDNWDIIYDEYVIGKARAKDFQTACDKYFNTSNWAKEYYDRDRMRWQGRILFHK